MENNALSAKIASQPGGAKENISAEEVLGRIKRLVSQDELQAVLGVSRTTMFERERAGKLPPSIKLGRSHFYDPADIHEWLEAQRSRPANQ